MNRTPFDADANTDSSVHEYTNANFDEIGKFTRLADEWWDRDGAFKSLHDINPLRLNWTEDKVLEFFGDRLQGKKVLDVGCGGGILSHALAVRGATAIYDRQSLDTSMGITPLEGLMMGTRCGDIDPSMHIHLHRTLGLSIEEIDTLFNKKSGLLGVSDVSNDMRLLEDAERQGNKDAKLALEMFAYRTAKYLLGLTAALPTLTGFAFTGGIGENGADMRAKIIQCMKYLGVKIDAAKNDALIRGAEGSFHAADSAFELWVIPTDEEFQIMSETRQVLGL